MRLIFVISTGRSAVADAKVGIDTVEISKNKYNMIAPGTSGLGDINSDGERFEVSFDAVKWIGFDFN